MLELKLFKRDRDIIRKSEERRYSEEVGLVDEIVKRYEEWKTCNFDLEQLKKEKNKTGKEVFKLKKAGEDVTCLIKNIEETERSIAEKEAEVKELSEELLEKQKKIGNIVHHTVPVGKDEKDNEVIRRWGEKRMDDNLHNHVTLVEKLGIADLKKGSVVAGNRGYYLKENGYFLNQALIHFGSIFLRNKGYSFLQTPFFMEKDIMAKCAQLAEFDEALYKVTGEGNDKYLIATAEQPMCAYHMNEWIEQSQLPLKYAAFSSCFRKEAGSHGRDTLGIYRLHQFEKIEQFCVTSPNGEDSWDMHEEMLKNSEEFYQQLELPYQVVNVVSGELNLAAAKKYDLEAWFPASRTYRELVSCSNCTDYQSRELEIRYRKGTKDEKQYCHLLNSTLTATERTICCILENYQKEGGVEVPKVLQPYMGGQTFMPFIK